MLNDVDDGWGKPDSRVVIRIIPEWGGLWGQTPSVTFVSELEKKSPAKGPRCPHPEMNNSVLPTYECHDLIHFDTHHQVWQKRKLWFVIYTGRYHLNPLPLFDPNRGAIHWAPGAAEAERGGLTRATLRPENAKYSDSDGDQEDHTKCGGDRYRHHSAFVVVVVVVGCGLVDVLNNRCQSLKQVGRGVDVGGWLRVVAYTKRLRPLVPTPAITQTMITSASQSIVSRWAKEGW